jgi:Ran GTPase-activating protein (RanGAP) involved in mRNA processing and transport
LYCDSNDIGEEGAEEIAVCMEMMDSLKKICMENNAIKDRGVIALAHALEENDTLLSLYLENNSITAAGAKEVGKIL